MRSMRGAPTVAAISLALALAGCGTAPRSGPRAEGGFSGRDGVDANPPPNLAQLPDAEPRIEPLRRGGPNRPYEVFGRRYTPLTGDVELKERGLASWYGRKFHGRPTSSGERYDMYAMTAAHKTMPLPSYARVRNPANGREVIVRVNDRGPFHEGRVIDLSYAAALKLGVLSAVAPVEVERITHAAIRSGAWREAGGTRTAPAASDSAAPATAAEPSAPSDGAVASTSLSVDTVASAVADEAPPRAIQPIERAAPGFWVQLGAFRERDGALDFLRKVERELEGLSPLMAVFTDRDLHRLQAGPYASRADAAGAAEQVRGMLQLVPLIVERR